MPSMSREQEEIIAHLRFISIALVAVAISVLTAGFIINGDRIAPVFSVVSVIACLYAFVTPLVRG
ncbi:hypothetical protein C467_05734 [Halorubrum hochstenium ATCC 700873]|uniref:Uncharacterized protein n=2 Tax=Haloferacaceae TaxID=1644056 RepID=M0FDI6_9EURY|nr:hypothetical protein C467_05734 [Halorubrum hochstenium ATCC 700873]